MIDPKAIAALAKEYAVPRYIISIDAYCWSYEGTLWKMPPNVSNLFEDTYPVRGCHPIEIADGSVRCPVSWLVENGERVKP